jgi:hypothetical protein
MIPMIFLGADEWFHDLLRSHSPVLITGIEFNLNRLPDNVIHVSGFGGEDGGVM